MAGGFSVAEAFTDLVHACFVAGYEFLHPDFRGGDEPVGSVSPGAASRGKAAGFKNFKAGFGDKVRREKGGVGFKVIALIEKTADLADYPGPFM
jgi:hypothetical protein